VARSSPSFVTPITTPIFAQQVCYEITVSGGCEPFQRVTIPFTGGCSSNPVVTSIMPTVTGGNQAGTIVATDTSIASQVTFTFGTNGGLAASSTAYELCFAVQPDLVVSTSTGSLSFVADSGCAGAISGLQVIDCTPACPNPPPACAVTLSSGTPTITSVSGGTRSHVCYAIVLSAACSITGDITEISLPLASGCSSTGLVFPANSVTLNGASTTLSISQSGNTLLITNGAGGAAIPGLATDGLTPNTFCYTVNGVFSLSTAAVGPVDIQSSLCGEFDSANAIGLVCPGTCGNCV
jgi:hypothetical protein